MRRRLAGVNASDGLREPDPALVSELVTALDGLPLAIELAGARSRTMSLKDLVAHLGQRFRLLRRTNSNSEHPQSLAHAIAWSIGQLQPAARSALAKTTVFQSAFTLTDVEAVLESRDDGDWAPDLVAALVDASLLEQLLPNERGESCYRLLSSVRDMAAEHLGSTEAKQLNKRHAECFAAKVSALELHPSNSLRRADVRELDLLAPDLLSARRWSSKHAPLLAVPLTLALDGWCFLRGSAIDRLENTVANIRWTNQDGTQP